MPPTDATVEAELRQVVHDIFNSDQRPNLTVNLVRKHVQDKLGLADGYFSDKKWKDRSKLIIKGLAVSAPSSQS
jgi:hypothetical protein